jgi:hypothetical protein
MDATRQALLDLLGCYPPVCELRMLFPIPRRRVRFFRCWGKMMLVGLESLPGKSQ